MYIATPSCGRTLCQHTLGDCITKFESNSFRSCCQLGTTALYSLTASKTQSAVCRLSSESKVRRHQTLAEISELANPLHYCAYATGCTEHRGLLTEHDLLLSEESLLRQPASASSCDIALAAWLLLCCRKWILQVPAVLFCHER